MECFADLQLLRKVVLYFLQMHNNHQSAKRLERVAEAFTRIAEAYVRQSLRSRQQASSGLDNKFSSIRGTSDSAACHKTTPPVLLDHCLFEFTNGPSLSEIDVLDQRQSFVGDLDSDPMALLNFISPSDSYMGPSNSFRATTAAWPAEVENIENAQQLQFYNINSDWMPNQLIHGIENIAQNYGLDGTFDWLSWDQYDDSTA